MFKTFYIVKSKDDSIFKVINPVSGKLHFKSNELRRCVTWIKAYNENFYSSYGVKKNV